MNWREKMEQMGRLGCFVTLHLSGHGWGCAVTDPEVAPTNTSRHAEPELAVEAAYAAWMKKTDAHYGVAAPLNSN